MMPEEAKLPTRDTDDSWVDNEWLAGLGRRLGGDIEVAREGSARRTYIGCAALVAYSAFLVYQTLHHRGQAGIADVPIWGLQDSHRLLQWIGRLVLVHVRAFLYFVPVGFVVAIVIPQGSRRVRRLPVNIGALAAGCAVTVLARAIEIGRSWHLAAAVGLVLPLLGCLFGAWMGATWRRGWRARLWFVPKAALLALLPALLAWGLSLGSPDRKAKVSLTQDSASLSASVGMPLGATAPRYLNMVIAGSAGVDAGILRLNVDRCKLGAMEVPRWLFHPLVPVVTSFLSHDRRSKPFLEATRWMAIEPQVMEVTYGPVHLPAGFREDLFGPAIVGEDVLASTRAQIEHLLAVVDGLPQSPPGFGTCMETVFTLARERSATRNPVVENQAGIFALGIVLGHPRVEEFVGDVHAGSEDNTAQRILGRVTLRGRSDWTRHFWVSAAIVILSNVAVSDAAGLLKEELDADTGGSGFSFSDLLADRAGTTFAVCATRDETAARAMQDRLAGGFRVEEFFPPADDLPEGLSDAELQRRYGSVGGQAYRRLTAEMERRIAGCAAYR
jgi:hypothetical protein